MDKNAREDAWLDPEPTHLREYWDIVLRRRRMVIAVTVGAIILAFAVSMVTPAVYRATVTLHIEPDSSKVTSLEDLFQVDATFDAFYQTQYRLIESRSLARRVIDRTGLLEIESADTGEPGYTSKALTWVTSTPRGVLNWVRRSIGSLPPTDVATQPGELREDPRYATAIDSFIGRLEVQPVRNTRLVRVSWSANDPRLAAMVVNSIAETYRDVNLEAKFETTDEANRFLASEIQRVREEIAEAETELQEFGGASNILSSDERQDTVTQGLSDLSAQFVQAQTDRVQKQTYLEQLRDADPATVPEVFGNSLVSSLRANLATLQQRYTELSRQFTDDWPQVQQVKAQITAEEERIAREEQSIYGRLVRNAENAFTSARDLENQFNGLLDDQRTAAMNQNRNLTVYRSLQIGIDSNKQLLESLLDRQSETGVSARLQGVRTSNIRVVDPAAVPISASSPKVKLNLMLGAILGLGLGIGIAFFQDYLDNTLNTLEDVENRTGFPALGLIPALGSANGNRYGAYGTYAANYGIDKYTEQPTGLSAIETISIDHPRSSIAEAYRSLRTSVLLSSAEKPPEVISITSAVPGEGKTSSSINLAISLAQAGKKVLLIDADLRRPRIHQALGMSQEPGLVHYLTGGSSSLKDSIHATTLDNLWIMPAGPHPPNPAELLASKRMASALQSLREAFDVVLIDTPPVMAVVDTVVLAPIVDGVVVVVHGGSTPHPLVTRSLQQIESVHGRIMGVLLNNIAADRRSYYGYKSKKAKTGQPSSLSPAAPPRTAAANTKLRTRKVAPNQRPRVEPNA